MLKDRAVDMSLYLGLALLITLLALILVLYLYSFLPEMLRDPKRISLLAVILTIVTENPVFDAFGSISIGALLIFVSFFLAIKIKSLLIGQSADKATINQIMRLLELRPEVERVLNVITQQMGAQIMVAVKAKMSSVNSVEELIRNINDCEKALKKMNPAIRWVFFEPDVEN
jgi:divalent metal cation (Fe/Co/Zn/Cd) transporter